MLIRNYKKICFSIDKENVDIDNRKIVVRVNNFNEEHFIGLGYNANRNDYIEVFVKELPIGSGLKIEVECQYCGRTFGKAYRRYLETKNDICCTNCKKFKMIKTSIDRYGSPCSLRDESIGNMAKATNLEKIGVEYPFQSKEVLKKCLDSFYANGSIKLSGRSKPQLYLHRLYGGISNYPEFPYKLDIFFEDCKIYFEYDGSGHDIGIKLKGITREEFLEKEILRSIFLKEKGYKEFRIISCDDILPSDDVLLGIKANAFDALMSKNYSKYIYDLNTKTESFEE